MLRVLHCIYDDPANPWVGGGGSLRVWEIYRRLSSQLDVTVATGAFPGARDEVREGVRYRRIGAPRPYAWSRLTYARAATRLLRAGDYDAAIVDFSGYSPVGLPRGRPVGLVIHMLHGPTAAERWGVVGGRVIAGVERRSIRSTRWISTTSRWMADQLRPLAHPAARITLAGSGIPDEFGRVQRRERDYLLFYGRFDFFQKGLDTVLDAFARIAPRFPALRLVLAGRGRDEQRLRSEVERLDAADRVELRPGVGRDEVLDLFSGALAMLMPSRLEGLPMAPAEAMAAGVPLIAARVGALPEMVDSPRTGLLVPPDDPAALAGAAESLLRDPAMRASVSAAARVAAERYSWDRVAREHLDFVRLVAAASPDPIQPQSE